MSNTSTSAAIDWAAHRDNFPIFKTKTYINSCSYGALSTQVADGFQAYLNDRHENGSDWYNWVDKNEALRADIADLFGAESDEIAVTTSASAGINAVASTMDFSGKRNKVIISDLDFPTSSQIWYAQEYRGAKVVRVGATENKTLLERMAEEIDEDTLIVAVAQVCYRNGEKLPIEAIRDLARAKGAYIMIDGYQCLGTTDINFTDLDVDFFVGGMLKYLLSTAGIGFLYANKKTATSRPPIVTGWFAQDNIHAMDDTRFNPSMTARRYESGTPPVPNIYACQAGLAILKNIGLANIEKRVATLTADIVGQAQAAGYTLATPSEPSRRGPMVAIKSTDDHALVAALGERGIIASCRDGNLRLSPHFYNTHDDIDVVFSALKSIGLTA